MVVDDEPDILANILRALQKYHFPIDDFTNPVKVLAHFEQHPGDYALVLSDIRMQGMSGLEFLNFIKRVRPDVPIMAMTAYSASDEDIAKAVLWIKKEEIVHKPFKTLEIRAAVKKTLKITA